MMKTKKKIVRLTESDLHNMISEAVKTALNELDPRTYASAAQKTREKGEYARSHKFANAAVDAFNQKYTEPVNAHFDNFKHGVQPHYHMDNVGGEYTLNQKTTNYKTNKSADIDYIFSPYGESYEEDDSGKYNLGDSMPSVSSMRDSFQVAKEMAQGNGKYAKGKGWE